MLTWPHEAGDWGGCLESVFAVFVAIAIEIAQRETLLSVCHSQAHLDTVRAVLLKNVAHRENLLFHIAPSNDVWARDHGPIGTLVAGKPRLNDFVFNGWGVKFPAQLDNAVSGELARQGAFGNTPIAPRQLVLEGGAIETDGMGTLLATRSSIITQTRNPGHQQDEIEGMLQAWLGFSRILWLEPLHICGDDTDGHIDTLARFADPSTILYATAPAGDTDHAVLNALYTQLRRFRTADNSPYRLIPLPSPGEHRDSGGRRLPASYTNFLLINGAVLLPAYGVPQDIEAGSVLRKAFPGRTVVPIDCRPLIRQNGSLHCLTMQFPAQVPLRHIEEIPAA